MAARDERGRGPSARLVPSDPRPVPLGPRLLTAGFVANTYYCNSWFGLGRGFARYEDFYDEDLAVSLAETLRCSTLGRSLVQLARVPLGNDRRGKMPPRSSDDLLDWLSEQETGPALLRVPQPTSMPTPPTCSPTGYDRHFGLRPRVRPTWPCCTSGTRSRDGTSPSASRPWSATRTTTASGTSIGQLGKLFDELERRGVLENTLVVVTSDHGENFGEHGLYGHGKSLYRQETHVPLVIVPPGGSRPVGRSADPVSLRDIPATVVDVLRHRPAHRRSRASPSPGTGSRDPRCSEPGDGVAFSEVALRDTISKNPTRPPAWRGPMQSLAAEGKSYIRNADGREELYDLAADPLEARDLAGLGRFRGRAREIPIEARGDHAGPGGRQVSELPLAACRRSAC